MTEKQQKYLTLYKSGMTYREVGEKCGVAAGTVCRMIKHLLDCEAEIVEEGKLTKKQKAYVMAMAENDMSMVRASQEMGIANSTFHKRIVGIERITGLNPRCFYDLVELVGMINKGEL